MNLTALEIKQRTFEKSLRGYDTAEVNAFLATIATEWEHLVGRMKDQEREIVMLRDKLKHYERVEAALHETLQTAKDSAEQRIETARKEALTRVELAEMEAEKILREVRVQRQEIRQSILRLIDRREEIIRGVGAYLDNAQRSLQSFDRDDAGIYTLPAGEGHKAATGNRPEPSAGNQQQQRGAGTKPDTTNPAGNANNNQQEQTGTSTASPESSDALAKKETSAQPFNPGTETGGNHTETDNTATQGAGTASQEASPGKSAEPGDRKKSSNPSPQKVPVPGGPDIDNILDEID